MNTLRDPPYLILLYVLELFSPRTYVRYNVESEEQFMLLAYDVNFKLI